MRQPPTSAFTTSLSPFDTTTSGTKNKGGTSLRAGTCFKGATVASQATGVGKIKFSYWNENFHSPQSLSAYPYEVYFQLRTPAQLFLFLFLNYKMAVSFRVPHYAASKTKERQVFICKINLKFPTLFVFQFSIRTQGFGNIKHNFNSHVPSNT